MFDTIKTLRWRSWPGWASQLHPNDTRRWPFQAGWGRGPQTRFTTTRQRSARSSISRAGSTGCCAARPSRTGESCRANRSIGIPQLSNSSFGGRIYASGSVGELHVPWTLKETDADGLTTKYQYNLRGQMKRSHEVVASWLSHWLRAARIPHSGWVKVRLGEHPQRHHTVAFEHTGLAFRISDEPRTDQLAPDEIRRN